MSHFSRRTFLKTLAAGIVAGMHAVASCNADHPASISEGATDTESATKAPPRRGTPDAVAVRLAEENPTSENRIRRSGVIAHDPEKCIVCAGCVVRCSTYHEGIASPELSRITLVADYYLTGNRSIAVCQQCEEPACLAACTSGAIRVDSETGARYIDDAICVGCGQCAGACLLMPEVVAIKVRVSNGEIRYFKCDLCRGRENGPACVEFCPYSALTLVSSEERV